MMHLRLSSELLDPLSGLDCLLPLSFWLLLYPQIFYPSILRGYSTHISMYDMHRHMPAIPISPTTPALPFFKRTVFKSLIRVINPFLKRQPQLKSSEKWNVTSPAPGSL